MPAPITPEFLYIVHWLYADSGDEDMCPTVWSTLEHAVQRVRQLRNADRAWKRERITAGDFTLPGPVRQYKILQYKNKGHEARQLFYLDATQITVANHYILVREKLKI